ncbi:MAG: type I-E CRISPR-associated protein Cas7/Cse4/CasC [Nitrospiraceae bacterium]|nr:type I-E CRISPR-associated protein Cas7/Cse4/CasC [Nitrospiraceae bacterium]
MNRFVQIHLLTSYPPANLNRDDQGRPKTAKMGGFDRLRISSQSLKRAWRSSDIFEAAIAKGIRTKMIGLDAFEKLSAFPTLSRTDREEIAKNIARKFGKLKGNSMELETLAFVSDKERQNISNVIARFEKGLGGATEESNTLGVKLFEILSQDISSSVNELLSILKGGHPVAMLKEDWAKALKEIVKKYKNAEDKSQYDFLIKMIDNSSEWLDAVIGDTEIRDDQLELFFADEYVKLAKDIVKKLSLGTLLSGKNARDITYGELKFKDHAELCKGWEEQLLNWIDEVKKSDDDDYLSEANIENLSVAISRTAIPRSAILTNENTNADISLFGRMLASSVDYNVEAACQVAHAISVHPVVIEDDYFTAVEEMNQYRNDAGAAHIGETGFAAGLFYSYICINRALLVDNLGGDEELAQKAIKALIEAAVKVAPEGKQNSFGSRAYASYVLAEKGDQQPRSLSVAFLKPVTSQGIEGTDFGTAAVEALTTQRKNMDAVYGTCADASCELNVFEGKGTLAELLTFVAE